MKNIDCIEALKDTENPLLVLFASTDEFGGGFTDMNVGQEESICRRSEMAGLMRYIGDEIQPVNVSQVNLNFMYLYTSKVKFFREPEEKKFTTFSPFTAGVLSSAALHKPEIQTDSKGVKHYKKQDDEDAMRKRIYHHVRFAEEQGYNTLVTGAFGCGAFLNPPEMVAQMYKEAIENSNCKQLKKMIFAILQDSNRSLETFQETFQVSN